VGVAFSEKYNMLRMTYRCVAHYCIPTRFLGETLVSRSFSHSVSERVTTYRYATHKKKQDIICPLLHLPLPNYTFTTLHYYPPPTNHHPPLASIFTAVARRCEWPTRVLLFSYFRIMSFKTQSLPPLQLAAGFAPGRTDGFNGR